MTLQTRPPQPGVVIKARVLARSKLTQAELARGMGISTVRLSQILNGHAPVTTEVPLRLGCVTNVPAEEWRALQVEHDLFVMRERLAGALDRLPQLISEDAAANQNRPISGSRPPRARAGDTITDFSRGDRIVLSDATLNVFNFFVSGNMLTYSGGSISRRAFNTRRL